MNRKLPLTLVVLALVTSAVAAAPEEVDYYAILSDGAKMGHMIQTRAIKDGKVVTTVNMVMNAARLGMPISVTTTREDVETPDGRPLAFSSNQDMSIMSQSVSGTIRPDGQCEVVTSAGGQSQKTQMAWPHGALLSEGTLLLQKRMGLKDGLTYSYVMFEPMSLRGMEVQVRIVARKDVEVLGRKENLWEVITNCAGVTATMYADEQYKALKTITAEGGLNLEIVACTKEYALGQDVPMEIMAKTIIPSPVAIEGMSTARAITYRLTPKPQAIVKVPAFDNQTVAADPSGITVIVSAQRAPQGAALRYAGNDPSVLAFLKPSPYVESDGPEVVALARQAVGATGDAAEAARRIEKFVHDYVTTKDLSVGYASAAEVVKTRSGDCSEHAVLAAALCRATGIPAQVVAGLLYVEDVEGAGPAFGPHAWVRVYIAGKWYNIDATTEHGYDPGHIALASGDGSPADFFSLVPLMGTFTIDSVVVHSMSEPTTRPGPARSADQQVMAPTGRISSPD